MKKIILAAVLVCGISLPARQASVARVRVLKTRTAQSHLSTRSVSGAGFTMTDVVTPNPQAKNFA